MDPFNMHRSQSHPQDNDMSNIIFPLNTSPTHKMIKWGHKFEPMFLPIPPECGSVPMIFKDE